MKDRSPDQAENPRPGETANPDAPVDVVDAADEKRAREDNMIRARQRSRAMVTGLILGALAILFYAIAIAKMTGGG